MNEPYQKKLEDLRQFFESGSTSTYNFRKGQLIKLRKAILELEEDLFKALDTDLGKSAEESYASEIGIALAEISFTLKHLKKWMRPKKVATNLVNFPSSAKIYQSPLGVVCIIGTWNYPFNLVIMPLIGAIAAGNCTVIKPSEFAPATAGIIQKMVEKYFQSQYITVIPGEGHEVIPAMMNCFRFDHIFYTGSTSTGQKIYEAAAKQLIPVTLEMGGKSPAVVEENADLGTTAKRIVLGKYLNAGQTCVAPDYVLVHSSVKQELIEKMIDSIKNFYSETPESSKDFGRIINEDHFNRLASYLKNTEIIFGGNSDKENLYFSPTIIELHHSSDIVMQDEIFGPILPVITYEKKEEALNIIRHHKNPLAFYLFTNDHENEKWWIKNVQFGGGCINNTLWHLSHSRLPFGGIGNSGIGNYHGKHSFDTFTHQKSVLRSPTWFDPKIKYPPFKGKMKWLKFFMK